MAIDTITQVTPPEETPDQALERALGKFKRKRVNEAIGICRDLLADNPNTVGALGLLGAMLGHTGKVHEAIELLEQAIALQPNVANWHLNLCTLYRGQNMLDKALVAGKTAVIYSPETAAHRLELALTHLFRCERDDAARCYRETLVCDPENAGAHMGMAELLLAKGEYLPGWREYAWRNKLEQARNTLPRMVSAPWNGMHMPEGTLLLVADQGFGDMIQFARYISMARERVPRLIIGWGPEVVALLGDHPDIVQCLSTWSQPEVPPHDAYVLLSTLPEIFCTDLTTIPLNIPYIATEPDKVASWAARLDAALPGDRLRVGIAWSGRSTHPNNARRSVRLETLAPILAVPDIDFVTVQKPFPEEDRAFAATLANLLDISAELESFKDTSAVMMALDLIIAVDTAVVHLAGALGRDAWVLVPEPSDWRWLLEREDSVWYPTLRLFRQKVPTEWGPVVDHVAAELTRHSSSFTIAQRLVA